jgi:hypothetical protein
MTIQESISQRALLSSIRQLISGNPDPDNSTPPGPWDPVIRWALQRTFWGFGPGDPEPWRWGRALLDGLKPQALPPRVMFFSLLAQEAMGRIGAGGDRPRLVDSRNGRCDRQHYAFSAPSHALQASIAR